MKKGLRIFLIAMMMISVSSVVYAEREEYKELNKKLALLYKNGNIIGAIDVAKEAVEVAKETFGANHIYVSASLNNLAMLYFKNGDYEEAKLNYEKSLSMTEELVGKTHPKIVKLLEDIKKCCEKLGEKEEIRSIDKRLETLHRMTSG